MSEIENAPEGPRPQCLHCKKPLRPNFDNEYAKVMTYKYQEEEPAPDVTNWQWDEEGQRYRIEHPVRRLVRRKFLGTYGQHNLFCSKEHGYLWAVTKGAWIKDAPVGAGARS